MSQPTPQAYQKCAAQHLGPWMVHAPWFAQAVAAVKAGTWKAEVPKGVSPEQAKAAVDVEYEIAGGDAWVLYYIENGVACVPMSGQVTKGDSKFGGVNSLRARRAVRKAVQDDRVSAILLHIDSPGGTVSGTGDLAGDVAKANAAKPVYTYFEDLGASAAYWIGSQARRVYANPTAEVGSIGTMTYVEDTSKRAEMEGVKVTLIATGKFKGQWVDGNPVSEEYIESVREEVNDLNEHFLAGVARGRRMSMDKVRDVADGRVWIAEKAKQLGLIDEVASLDAAIAAITKEVTRMNADTFRQYAAEHPESAEVKEIVARGHKAGYADAVTVERKRHADLVAACPGRPQLAISSFQAGQDADAVKITVAALDTEAAARKSEADAAKAALEAKDKEIEKLKFEKGNQGAVGTAAAAAEAAKEDGKKDLGPRPDGSDPAALNAWAKASAEQEFDSDKKHPTLAGVRSKAGYVAMRAEMLKGNLKTVEKKPA